jgi:N-acetylglucosaminyl-diphospho-decaprenol L-rhamnosyltransferase
MSRRVLPTPAQAPVRQQKRPAVRVLPEPQLSIVIVNYRQWDQTAALVRQILQHPAAVRGAVEVVVVDNHSPPHPLAKQMRRKAGVSVRRWGRNRGFARAVNEGCRLSRGRWYLLLNPDLTLTAGFLDGVLELAERLQSAQGHAGIVGFQLLNADGTRQLSSGFFPTLGGTLAGLALPRERRKYHTPSTIHRCRVPWVTGCCLLLRRECLQQLGGMDESFFLYYEDVDLCRRARALGWSVWFEPAVCAIHHQPLHVRAVPPRLRLITRHALLTYGQRHWPGWQFDLLAAIVCVEAWGRKMAARWRGDRSAEMIFSQLGAMAAECWRGDRQAARRRLRRVVGDADPRS